MFRRIGGPASKRLGALMADDKSQKNLLKVFLGFSERQFGQFAGPFQVELRQHTIFVRCQNKVIAQELILQSAALAKHLEQNSIGFKQIVIQ